MGDSASIRAATQGNRSQVKAFVLDDSIKARRGKKMEDVSSHYDHTTNHHVMGQQVLTLGLVSARDEMSMTNPAASAGVRLLRE